MSQVEVKPTMTRTTFTDSKKTKAKAKPKLSTKKADSLMRKHITVALGCGIPCFSLALSAVGGRLLLEQQYALGAFSLTLCCAVLAVSLDHLAWAIKDITKSNSWQSWCIAAAIDLSLVMCELAGVAGFSLWIVPCIMVSVTVTSAALNCWAFLRHCK
jgi:hypothetical protein